jgi:hypothetical protein
MRGHRTGLEFTSVRGKTQAPEWLKCGLLKAVWAIQDTVIPQNTPDLPRYTALRNSDVPFHGPGA